MLRTRGCWPTSCELTPQLHRFIPRDSELTASIRVLARAHQDAIWDRQQTVGKLRSILREFYPALVATFEDLSSREARATLTLAPSPAAVPKVRRSSLASALRRAGRTRYIDRDVEKILAGLRVEHLRQPVLVEAAMAVQASAYARALTTLVDNIRILQEQLEVAYQAHPDARVIASFPGLGTVLGARILGEIGDDRTRSATARGLKAFAGTAPITRASGTKTLITFRCWPAHPEAAPTTTGDEPPATATPWHHDTWPTVASACSNTARGRGTRR